MLKKEVKQYKRSSTSFVYRVDLSKRDNLEGGDTVYVLTEQEQENQNKAISELKAKLETLEIEYNELLTKYTTEIKDQTLAITKINKQYNETIEENNKQKSIIAMQQILITKLKHRSFINRILNKNVTLNKQDKEFLGTNEVYEIDKK